MTYCFEIGVLMLVIAIMSCASGYVIGKEHGVCLMRSRVREIEKEHRLKMDKMEIDNRYDKMGLREEIERLNLELMRWRA